MKNLELKRIFPLLFLGILFVFTRCTSANSLQTGTVSADSNSQVDLAGTEEFGLTRKGLVTAIESVEASIAQCMIDNGFEYVAVDYNTVRQGMQSDKSLPGYTERQYFQEFGFGISTLYTGKPPQLADVNTPAQIGLGQRNVAIFADLSEADRVAYNHTLLGNDTNTTFAVGLEIEDFSQTGGCTRQAIEEHFTAEQIALRATSPKDALIEQDPRMVEAIGKFSDCVRAEGFDYDNESQIEPDMRDRLAEITQGLPVEALSTDAQSALAELQGYERKLAVTSLNCELQYLDPVEDQVESELFGR